jgi:hypothetical protein
MVVIRPFSSKSGKGAGAKGKGKGKSGGGGGGGGGQWVFIPQTQVQTSFRQNGSGKKGGKKGGGKGKKGSKGPKKQFADLSDEKKEEIRAKHAEKQAEQGREEIGDVFFFGEVAQRGKSYGWIKPSSFGKLPMEVQEKVKEMMKAKKANVKESQSTNEVFKTNVLFLHMSDVEEGVKVSTGDRVKFKVYVDNEGAGAREVTSA